MNKKFILFMTSLSLAVAPMGVFASEYSGPTATIEAVEGRANLQAATGEYKSWKQYDPRWASQRLGSSADTMSESGCLVVAIAALMVHSGCADENGVDPGKLCTYLSNNGGFTSNGELYWGKVNGAVDGFSLASWGVDLSGSRYDKVAQIKSYLDRGYYVVASVGYGAHWVAVDSADGDGNINIFDPAYSYSKLFGNYSDAGVTRIALFSGNGSGNGSIDVPSNGNNTTLENYNATGKVNVGASYLNVRNGVGTDKGYLTDSVGNRITLQNNETVTITGKGKDSSGNVWYRVAINGLTGYVFGAYIEITTNSNNNNNNTSQEKKSGKVNASYVNVRSGAGTNYSILAVASQNEEITVLGEEKDSSGATWYKIDYDGTAAYIHSDYVTLDQTNNNNNNNNTTDYPEKSAKVNASSVNVRSGAGTNNGVVATLALNTSLTVVGEEKDGSGATWYKIKYDGGEGYMHSDYVTISENNNNNNNNNNGGTTTPSRTGTVNADYVNVRTGAGTNNSRVTSLNSGAAVTIVGEEKDSSGATWYKINYAGGSGYMHSDYVTVNGDNNNGNNNNNNSGYEKKDGTVNASSVNVRSGAGTGNSIVGNLSSGTAITIIGEEKDSSGAVWYKIEYNGGSGYMHSDYITVGGGNNNNNNNNNGGNGSGNYPMEGIEGKEGVINAALVNVRTEANSDAEVMNTLKSGVSVLIESAERDGSGVIWYKVAFAGTSGYVMAEFISIQ